MKVTDDRTLKVVPPSSIKLQTKWRPPTEMGETSRWTFIHKSPELKNAVKQEAPPSFSLLDL